MKRIIYILLVLFLVGCTGKSPLAPSFEDSKNSEPEPTGKRLVYYASDDGVRTFPGHYPGLKVDDDAQLSQLWKGFITRQIDLSLLDANVVTVRILDFLGNVLVNGDVPVIWGRGLDTIDIKPDHAHRMTGYGFWPESQPYKNIYFTVVREGEGHHLSWPEKLYYSYTGFAPDPDWLPWLQNTRSFTDDWYYYYSAVGHIPSMNNQFIIDGPDGQIQIGQGGRLTEIVPVEDFVYSWVGVDDVWNTIVLTIRPK